MGLCLVAALHHKDSTGTQHQHTTDNVEDGRTDTTGGGQQRTGVVVNGHSQLTVAYSTGTDIAVSRTGRTGIFPLPFLFLIFSINKTPLFSSCSTVLNLFL